MSLGFHLISDLVTDCVGTAGSASPQLSTVITSQNIDPSHLSVSSVSTLQTSPDTPSTERRHDPGGRIDFCPYSLLQEDQNIASHLVSDSLHDRPPSPCASTLTLSYDDPHQTVLRHIMPGPGYNPSNAFSGRLATQSHVIPWDEKWSTPRKHQITDDLQTQAGGIPSAGLYRRNSRSTSFDPEYKHGVSEVRFSYHLSSPG